jgi:hypothetical protein
MARNALTNLTPLPLNSGLSVSFTHTAAQGAFTGATLALVIDITQRDRTVTRVTLTEADAELSNSDLTATITGDADWSAANLVAGRARALLFVNGVYDSGIRFDVYEPDGGEVTL